MSSFQMQDLTVIPLFFCKHKSNNHFKDKNNKTLQDTILSPKYKKLSSMVTDKYSNYLDTKLGNFLMLLKNNNDSFYKKFLNKYGDLEYCEFSIKHKQHYNLKGVYFYFLNDELKYIGRCKDSIKQRVNSGYGRISPKKCFLDGQSTNCKVNALVSQNIDDIELRLFIMDDDTEIEKLESELIVEFEPERNH